jgi:hypothetical protein
MWDTHGDNFYCLASKVFASSGLLDFSNQGMVKLIPKMQLEIPLGVGSLSLCSQLLIKSWLRLWL